MQNRGMQIVNVHFVFDGVVAVLVGGTISMTPLDPAAGHPHREPVGIVVTAIVALGCRCASELASPQHERVFQQSSRLQVGQKAGDRLVDLR